MTACDEFAVIHIRRAVERIHSEVTIKVLHFLEKGNE